MRALPVVQRQRPFGIPDQHVYVCESKYDLQTRTIARLDPATDVPVPIVPPAETTTFPFPLTLTKVASPHLAAAGGAVVVGGSSTPRGGAGVAVASPHSPAKPPHVRKRLQTKENLEKELGSSRSQIEEAKKKLVKLVARATRQVPCVFCVSCMGGLPCVLVCKSSGNVCLCFCVVHGWITMCVGVVRVERKEGLQCASV